MRVARHQQKRWAIRVSTPGQRGRGLTRGLSKDQISLKFPKEPLGLLGPEMALIEQAAQLSSPGGEGGGRSWRRWHSPRGYSASN